MGLLPSDRVRAGWTRYQMERAGRVCLLGAVRGAANDGTISLQQYCDLLDAAYESVKGEMNKLDRAEDLDAWNDAQTSKGPVVRVLEKAERACGLRPWAA
jgi:hypothetical protein